MSTVLYRTESPYIPRPIEAGSARAPSAHAGKAVRKLRILLMSFRPSSDVAVRARALAELGHHVDVATPAPAPRMDARLHIHALHSRSAQNFGERVARFAADQSVPHDVVHDDGSLPWALLKLKRAGLRVVSSVRQKDVAEARFARRIESLTLFGRPGLNRMRMKVARELDCVIASSHATIHELEESWGIAPERLRLLSPDCDPRIAAAALSEIYAPTGNA